MNDPAEEMYVCALEKADAEIERLKESNDWLRATWKATASELDQLRARLLQRASGGETVSPEFHQCQHPFGEGVHVVVLSPPLACIFIEMTGIEEKVGVTYNKLCEITGPGEIGHACALYQGNPPANFTAAWIALKLSCQGEEKNRDPRMRGIAVFSDPGFEKLAGDAAKLFKVELKYLELPPEET